jgi:peptide/nickel transport system permease protein
VSQSPSSQFSPTAIGEHDALPAVRSPQEQRKKRLEAVLSRILAWLSVFWGLVTFNRKVMVGCSIIGFFVMVAIFGLLFVHQDPLAYTTNLVAAPSFEHWLGTNQAGQDVFIQMIVGTRVTLFWSFVTGLAVLVISVTIGLVGGYFGGVADDILSVLTNVFLVIPALPLAIVASQYFARTEVTIAVVVALTNWPWGARVIRAQTLSMRNREFVTAAQAGGERSWRVIFAEIFPNQLSIVAANFVTTTIQVLLAVAGLEFLGFGNTFTVSWGTILYGAYTQGAIILEAWWWFVPPGLCIALLGAGLALLNFGIDEIADPRLRRERPAKSAKKSASKLAKEKAVADGYE